MNSFEDRVYFMAIVKSPGYNVRIDYFTWMWYQLQQGQAYLPQSGYILTVILTEFFQSLHKSYG